jgi:hypothetical protein
MILCSDIREGILTLRGSTRKRSLKASPGFEPVPD